MAIRVHRVPRDSGLLRAPNSHHHVADEFVERAVVRVQHAHHFREVLVQLRNHRTGLAFSRRVKPRISENSTVISRRVPPSFASDGFASS